MEYSTQNIRSWSRLGSNGAMGFALNELVAQNSNVMALTADLCSFSGLEQLRDEHPEQYRNLGIAEQNMIGVACGLAREGFDVFATTYASFASTRCLDQVKNGIGYMGLPIKVVGLSSGFSMGQLGATHMSCDDISIMRSIPGMTVISPADCTEVVKAVFACAEYPSPVYLRLTGLMPNPPVYREDYSFEIGKAVDMVEGADICIIATGSMVHESIKAAKLLQEEDISARVINMHTIKPLDEKKLVEVLGMGYQAVVTVEEHGIIGGLGSAVSEFFASRGCLTGLLMLGGRDAFFKAASYGTLLEQNDLTSKGIAKNIVRYMQSSN